MKISEYNILTGCSSRYKVVVRNLEPSHQQPCLADPPACFILCSSQRLMALIWSQTLGSQNISTIPILMATSILGWLVRDESNRFFSRFTGVLTGQGEDREKWKGEAIIKPLQRKVVDGLTAPSILSFIFHIPLHLWCVYIVIQGYMQYLVTSPLHRLLRKEKNYHII